MHFELSGYGWCGIVIDVEWDTSCLTHRFDILIGAHVQK